MTQSPSNLRGILYMVLATGCFLLNDSLLKIAMADVPPFEALFIRAVVGVLLGVPVLAATGALRRAPMMFQPLVLVRNGLELAAAAGYIFALAFAPLADITAMGQLTPMLVMLGAVVFFGDRIGRLASGLIALAFVGALLVAQPGGSGFQPFALLGLWSALGVAFRDLIGRRIRADVPALVVAVGASAVSLVGVGILMLVFERPVMPSTGAVLCLAAAAALLTLGQLLLFSAYRVAEMSIVVPFFYTGTAWALLLGILLFNTVPNPLGLTGMMLILVSGVLVVVSDHRARRAAMPG